MEKSARSRSRTGLRDPDGLAVAAFVMGVVGLVVLPVCLGPLAVVLAVLALRGGTRRRRVAFAGLALGVADLVVFVVTLASEHDWLVRIF